MELAPQQADAECIPNQEHSMRSRLVQLAVVTTVVTILGIAAVSVANAVATNPPPTSIVRKLPGQHGAHHTGTSDDHGTDDDGTGVTETTDHTSTTVDDHGTDE